MFLGKEVHCVVDSSEENFTLPGIITTTRKQHFHIHFLADDAISIIENAYVEFATNSLGYHPLGVYDWEFKTGHYDNNLVDQVFPNLYTNVEEFLCDSLEKSIETVKKGYPITQELLQNYYYHAMCADKLILHKRTLPQIEVKSGQIRIEFDFLQTENELTFQLVPIAWYYLEQKESAIKTFKNSPYYSVITEYVNPESSISEPQWQPPVEKLIGKNLDNWFEKEHFESIAQAQHYIQNSVYGKVWGWRNRIIKTVNNVRTEISWFELKKLINQSD
jgi:hypothetical protein